MVMYNAIFFCKIYFLRKLKIPKDKLLTFYIFINACN
jgi:hypothetical protein